MSCLKDPLGVRSGVCMVSYSSPLSDIGLRHTPWGYKTQLPYQKGVACRNCSFRCQGSISVPISVCHCTLSRTTVPYEYYEAGSGPYATRPQVLFRHERPMSLCTPDSIQDRPHPLEMPVALRSTSGDLSLAIQSFIHAK